ncbi:MAG: flap endonuclease [Deltaproteobacteria bacterium]|nr:flap endonuclease [Deltaproteobacteria bacterium]
MRIHLVDGTYELFRAYYGAPQFQAADGREIGAVRAFARSMLSLLRDGATHVGVAFDTVIESFRNDLFAGYKTGEGIEPALLAQFPWAEETAEALGLIVWRMRTFEADDALATFAMRAAADGRVEEIVLCSPDKDLCQCVRGERIVALDRRQQRRLDAAGVKEKFGIEPESIPDYLALVGDSADGIPGIPKWGAKAAASALAAVRHLEAIPDDPAKWTFSVRGKDGLAASLNAHREEAALYKTLATLRVDVPLDETVDDLAWRGADRAKLAEHAELTGDSRIVEDAAKLEALRQAGTH